MPTDYRSLLSVCVWGGAGEHSTHSMAFLLGLAWDGAVFLPSLGKTAASGGELQDSRDDKSVWLRLSLWFLVNQ